MLVSSKDPNHDLDFVKLVARSCTSHFTTTTVLLMCIEFHLNYACIKQIKIQVTILILVDPCYNLTFTIMYSYFCSFANVHS